jgi:hypothetical protein
MAIERELLRSCLLEALKRKPQTQYENLKYEVGAVAAVRGFPVQNWGGQSMLDRADWRTLREMIWRLIAEGVLVVGMDDSNESWPFVSLTEYGERYVKDQRATPHDRSAFTARLVKTGTVDDVEQLYVSEALEAYSADLPNAAAVMIGAASEHALILLLSDIAAKDATQGANATAALDQSALKMLRFAERYLRTRQANLPRHIRETLDTTFMGIANLIRMARNDAGHPALSAVDRERCFVALQLYPDYRGWVFEVRALLPL